MSNVGKYKRISLRKEKRRFEKEKATLLKVESFSIPDDAVYLKDSETVIAVGFYDLRIWAYRNAVYRHMVVKFCVNITGINPMTDEEQTFYSIDTAHGAVHYHRYDRAEKQQGVILEPLVAGNWNLVNDWYYKAQDICFDIAVNEYNEWVKTFQLGKAGRNDR